MELSSVLERNHGGLFTTNLPHETDISESVRRLENRNLHSLPVTMEQVEEVKTFLTDRHTREHISLHCRRRNYGDSAAV